VKRRIKIILALALLLVLGYVILLSSGNYRRQLEAYKQQLRARGEKLLVSEVAPPHATNTTNAAATFFGASSFSVASALPAMMTLIGPGCAMVGHTNPAPALPNYDQATRFVSELRAALTPPSLDFNLDYAKGFEIMFPHLARLKTAEVLATGTSIEALHRQDFQEAWQDLNAAVDLVRLYNNEPLLISGLVRVADANIAASATWEFLQSNQWTDGQLAELQAKWEAMDFFRTAEPAVTVERAINMQTFARARSFKHRSEMFPAGMPITTLPTSNATVSLPGRIKVTLKEFYDDYPGFWPPAGRRLVATSFRPGTNCAARTPPWINCTRPASRVSWALRSGRSIIISAGSPPWRSPAGLSRLPSP
jgi:hypothetical protein